MNPRTPFAAVVLFALGCTARASGGGGGALLDTDAGNGGTDVVSPGVDVVIPGVDVVIPGGTCDTLCARLTGVAGCTPSSVAACVSGCDVLAATVTYPQPRRPKSAHVHVCSL